MNENTPPLSSGLSKDEVQRIKDEEHLHLIAIFHYIKGGLSCLAGCLGFFYIGFAFIMSGVASNIDKAHSAKCGLPAAFLFLLFVVLGTIMIIFGLGLGIADFIAARKIKQHRARTFTYIVAALNCLSIPFGTALGIWTFMVLSRPSVQALYDKRG